MKVVLAVQISGTRDGKEWPAPGTEVDLPEAEARDLVASGQAYAPDDDKVETLRGGALTKVDLAGAPTGRDITEGQQDTHLARARVLAQEPDGGRKVAREAAAETHLDDEHTVPQADPDAPVVGDGKPNPTDGGTDSATATRSASGPVESAAVDTKPAAKRSAGSVETATEDSTAKGRKA